MTNHETTMTVPLAPCAQHLQLEIPLAGGVIATPTGMRVPPDISKADFEHALDVVFRMEDWAALCKSDAIAAARARFGDAEAGHMLRRRGIDQRQVQKLFRLESVEVRVADLSAEHHFAVSGLDAIDQGRWLETARREHLSGADLRASIRANAVVRAVPQVRAEGGSERLSATTSPHSIGLAFVRWRAEAEGSLDSWPVELWRSVRDALEPVARFYEVAVVRVRDAEAGSKLKRTMGGDR